MRLGKLSDSATPCRDVLVLLLRGGLRAVALLSLLAVVLNWPVQLLLAYLGLAVVTGIAACVEAWDRHYPRQLNARTTLPAETPGTDPSDTSPKDQ